jgi:exodeoxyribonuclease X
MTFGKHKGVAITDIPRDYKTWLLNQDNVDAYLRKALEANQ